SRDWSSDVCSSDLRVGEGHAQFNDVHALLHQGMKRRQGCLRVGIATDDVGNQCLAAFFVELVETAGNSIHCRSAGEILHWCQLRVRPSSSATVIRSLSPRPDRLTMMIWSLSDRKSTRLN